MRRGIQSEKELADFIKHGHKHYLPHMTIDCAIFGYHERQLKILLGKWKYLNGYGLPGGFIKRTERMSEAAQRILTEKTGLDNLYLEQFHTFGDTPYRVTGSDEVRAIGSWLAERTIAIGYYALVEFSKVSPTPDYFIEEYHWHDVHDLPELLFDHNDMVNTALEHLRINLYHKPIGYNLLEKKFTLPEIQSLYETILGRTLDRRNFPKKLISLGLIKDTNHVRHIGQHRSPKLYSFDKKNYTKALREGIVLVL
jgi:8-oxo-dGTP diphosphatase